MSTLHLVILCFTGLLALVIVSAACALAAYVRAEARSPRHTGLVGSTVVVHTEKPDDQSIKGVVAAEFPDELVLSEARYLGPDGTGTPAKGEVRVPRRKLSTFQVVEAPQV